MNTDIDSPEQMAKALLGWYVEMGVDETLSSEPSDWFALSEQAAQQKAQARQPARQPQPGRQTQNHQQSKPQPQTLPRRQVTPPDGAVLEAREKATSAKSLEELEQLIRSFDGCGLKSTAKNTCISRGSPSANLMFIGEAPGRDEDLQGKPFVGRAGQLLDKMLTAISRDESNAYITNIVYWRPPGNRTPTPQEAQICRPFLIRQIELIKPAVIVFLGGAAAKHMLDTTEGIMRLRGKWKPLTIGEQSYKTMATLHPAYLLRTPAGKKRAWQDFLAIMKELHTQENKGPES